jgi:uncharacterized membrane protein YozB (DUF420 family)
MSFQFFHALLALGVVVIPLVLIWVLMAWEERGRSRRHRRP